MYNLHCEEGENFYNVSYSPKTSKVIAIKLDNLDLPDECFERVCSTADTSPISTIVCEKSEAYALKKAAQVFKDYFENMAEKVSDALYKELNNKY